MDSYNITGLGIIFGLLTLVLGITLAFLGGGPA